MERKQKEGNPEQENTEEEQFIWLRANLQDSKKCLESLVRPDSSFSYSDYNRLFYSAYYFQSS